MVAIKVFNAFYGEHQADAFLRELKAMGRVADHPNVAQVYEAGRTSNRTPFMVMPLYPNGSLAERILQQGPLDLASVIRIGIKMCGALESAHRLGVIHGDVKPHNILLTRTGDVVLADFGISRLLEEADSDQHLAFTPLYSAPELFTEHNSTPAADVYSLGATLYECASGTNPYADIGDAMSILATKATDPAPRLEGEDGDFADVLADAMALAPESRTPSAEAFGRRLQRLQISRGLPVTDLIILGDLRQRGLPADDAAPLHSEWQTGDGSTTSVPILDGPRNPRRATADRATDTVAAPGVRSAPPPEPAARRSRLVLRPPAARERFVALLRLLHRVASAIADVFRFSARKLVRSRGQDGDGALPSFASLTADRPTAIDLLGYEPLSDGLCRLLNDPGTAFPITIGVTGQWGSGKSSLMLQLRDRLRQSLPGDTGRRWLCVWFDAWRFQGRESLWAGLARSIYQQTQTELGPLHRRLLFRVRLERRRRGSLRFGIGVAALFLGAAICIATGVRAWAASTTWLTLAGLGAAMGTLGTAASYVGVVGAPFERAMGRGSVTKKYDEFLGISDQAERDVEHLLAVLTDNDPSAAILVFLDDLDRCQAGIVAEALTTITEVFGRREGARIGFVLGVDMDVVIGAVDSYLVNVRDTMRRLNPRRADELSAHFLEKVFQLTIAIDRIPHLPVQRLFVGASGEPADDSSDQEVAAVWRSALNRLSIENPAAVTQARRQAGIVSERLTDTSLIALRSAVRNRRAELLTLASSDVRSAEERVIRVLSLTPRAAKRFDNAFRLQLQVANGTPGSKLGFNVEQLTATAKWVALRLFFAPACRVIDRQPGLLDELEKLAAERNGALQFKKRLTSLLPAADPSIVSELIALLSVDYPETALAQLPLDSFPNIA